MRTNIYVDGFNLYYGALRGTPFKWLDIRRMCELLLPNHSIARVSYFTARISARPDDPGQPVRQQTYPSQTLRRVATFVKPIRKGVLATSQLPTTIRDQYGMIRKPVTW